MNRSFDEEEILRQLQLFVAAWQHGETERLDECVVEEPFIYFSTHGKCYTCQDLRFWFDKPDPRINRAEMRIENHVCLIHGNRAQQCAVLLGYFADDHEEVCRHIGFGGNFANTLVKIDGRWMLETVRFELRSDNGIREQMLSEDGFIVGTPGIGDHSLIKTWKQVNDRIGCFMEPVEGQGEFVILGDFDAPWYVIPVRDNTGDDEDQIRELFARCCFAYDYNAFSLMNDALSDEVRIETSKADIRNKHDAIAYLKILRQASPRSLHAGVFDRFDIHGDTADCEIVCLSAEALSLTRGGDGSLSADFSDGRLHVKASKLNGCWSIFHIACEAG